MDVGDVTCFPRGERYLIGGKRLQNPEVVADDVGQEPVVTLCAVENFGDGDRHDLLAGEGNREGGSESLKP